MRQEVKLVEPLGFCYGVKRAVNLAEQALKSKPNKKIYSLGEIIHNTDTVRKLSQEGLVVKDNLKGTKKGNVMVVSSHGIGPDILKEAKTKGIEIINTTCPNVITSQRLCNRLKAEGYFIVIVGDRRHREIESLRGFAGDRSIVIRDEKEARSIKIDEARIGVVVQTTQSKENFVRVLKELIAKDYVELKIFNTICNDTSKRQKAALSLAKDVDVIFVVGGKHSANTRRLFELCRKIRRRCYHIENDKELRLSNVRNANTIGVVSGASTPDWVIKKVLKKISEDTTQH